MFAYESRRAIWPPKPHGYCLGVELTADNSASVPLAKKEIDLIVLHEGKLTIAECKASGETLTVDEVKRTLTIAAHLECSGVIFATPGRFPDRDSLLPEDPELLKLSISWVTVQD